MRATDRRLQRIAGSAVVTAIVNPDREHPVADVAEAGLALPAPIVAEDVDEELVDGRIPPLDEQLSEGLCRLGRAVDGEDVVSRRRAVVHRCSFRGAGLRGAVTAHQRASTIDAPSAASRPRSSERSVAAPLLSSSTGVRTGCDLPLPPGNQTRFWALSVSGPPRVTCACRSVPGIGDSMYSTP